MGSGEEEGQDMNVVACLVNESAGDSKRRLLLSDLPEECLGAIISTLPLPAAALCAAASSALRGAVALDATWRALCLSLPAFIQFAPRAAQLELDPSSFAGGWQQAAKRLKDAPSLPKTLQLPAPEEDAYGSVRWRGTAQMQHLVHYSGEIGGDRCVKTAQPWVICCRRRPKRPPRSGFKVFCRFLKNGSISMLGTGSNPHIIAYLQRKAAAQAREAAAAAEMANDAAVMAAAAASAVAASAGTDSEPDGQPSFAPTFENMVGAASPASAPRAPASGALVRSASSIDERPGDVWSRMTRGEKEFFYQQAEVLQMQYEEELQEWGRAAWTDGRLLQPVISRPSDASPQGKGWRPWLYPCSGEKPAGAAAVVEEDDLMDDSAGDRRQAEEGAALGPNSGEKLVVDLLPVRYFEITVLRDVGEMEAICGQGSERTSGVHGSSASGCETGGGGMLDQGSRSGGVGAAEEGLQSAQTAGHGGGGGGEGVVQGGGWGAAPWAQEWCLSVGISLECMRMVGKQPGWDCSSAAVHSDDGRFYFDNAHQPQNLKFGPGDTVGCGLRLDLPRPVLFYTVNGVFHSFVCMVSLSQDVQVAARRADGAWLGKIYPTCGIDSLCPVKLNTGWEPFCFDLTSESLWTPILVGGVKWADWEQNPPSGLSKSSGCSPAGTRAVRVDRWIKLAGDWLDDVDSEDLDDEEEDGDDGDAGVPHLLQGGWGQLMMHAQAAQMAAQGLDVDDSGSESDWGGQGSGVGGGGDAAGSSDGMSVVSDELSEDGDGESSQEEEDFGDVSLDGDDDEDWGSLGEEEEEDYNSAFDYRSSTSCRSSHLSQTSHPNH